MSPAMLLQAETPKKRFFPTLFFCSIFNRFLQNNKIRMISPKAFAGLSQLKML